MSSLYATLLTLLVLLTPPRPSEPARAGDVRVPAGYNRVAHAGRTAMEAGPGASFPLVRHIHKGAVVRVIGGPYNRRWYKALYRGQVGYIRGGHLRYTGLAGGRIAGLHHRVVVLSLARQQIEIYERGRLLLVSSATTGQPSLPTPTGASRVMEKRRNYTFVSPWPKGHRHYYKPTRIDYAIRYRDGGYYIHNAPWRTYHGYGTNVEHTDPDGVQRTGSHGCVNVPYWAMVTIYRWMEIGTVVRVVAK